MRRFISEVVRRRVLPVAAFYVAGAWVVLEVASLAFESWGIPPQRLQLVWLAAFAGFPIALLFGWRYDLVGGRVLKTPASEGDEPQPLTRVDFGLFGATVIAVVASVGFLLQADTIEAPTTKPVIAVMPFDDLSVEQNQAYFADGIAEETLNLLARFDGLTVIARRASFALRDEAVDVERIAGRLGVTHVLEGSVRRLTDSVRVSAQLVDASHGTTIWSKTYEDTFNEIYDIQEDLANEVARELKARLLVNVPRHELGDPRMFDTYLRAISLLARREPGDAENAASLFEQVTEAEPEFAPAWGSLAIARFWMFAERDKTLEAAVRALELDPHNSDGLAIRGRLLTDQRKFKEGRELLRAAIRANPSNPMPMRWLAASYSWSDPAEYATLVERAIAIDPLDPSISWHAAIAAVLMGQDDDALEAAESLVTSMRYDVGLQYAVATHESFGRLALAVKSGYLGYLETGTRNGTPWWHLPKIFENLGELDLAEAWTDELERAWGTTEDIIGLRASIAALHDDFGEASRIVTEGQDSGTLGGPPLAVSLYLRVHDAPGARAVLEELFGDWRDIPAEEIVEIWIPMRAYAATLKDTGDMQAAAEIADILIAHLKDLVSRRVVNAGFFSINQQLAELYAVKGDTDAMYHNLERALSLNLLFCRECMQLLPAWDPYRNDPRFLDIIAQQERFLESQRVQLEREGMLMTPAELRKHGKFDFDPFSR